MSREARIFISRLIVVSVFISSIIAAVSTNFTITLITVSGGLIIWLFYLLSADLGARPQEGTAESTLGQSLSRVIAGLGAILAVSALGTYGLNQTIWGGYTFNVMGLALALAVVLLTLMPLMVLKLLNKSDTSGTTRRPPPPPEQAYPPLMQPTPNQPYAYDPNEEDILDEEDEEKDWDEEDEDYDDEYDDEEDEEEVKP